MEAEEVTLLACLLGRHGERKLTGVFGHVMLLWEALRHDRELVELLAKQRTPPTEEDWKGDHPPLLYGTPLFALVSDIASTPGFPDTPFLAIEEKDRVELIELFKPGQPAFEIAKVEILEDMGVFEKFKNLAALARSRSKPRERRSEPAIMKREKGDPDKPVYDADITFRPYMGIEAVREGFERWLKDNSKLFTNVDTSFAAQRRWDPRPKLSDLAILRLVKLYGYLGTKDWTRENRPHKGIKPYIPSDYESYFVEGKEAKGDRPLYEKGRQYEAAVRRALAQISKR
jgi:hypothetical protein